jgi:hypothetical protein
MTYRLTVEAADYEGWAIFVDRLPVIDFNDDGETDLDLGPGEHSLLYDLRGSGATLSIDLQTRPPIIVPIDAQWPFEVEVPGDSSVAADRLYFVIGG